LIKSHLSSVLTVGAWVIGYFSDGLAAVEASDPLEQATLAARMSGLIGGPRSLRVEPCQKPAVH
jgi:hypothetical protein